jgi:hypothetical protein
VSLSDEGNGMLRLASQNGSSIYDLVFAKPTSILGIRGAAGLDRLVLNNVDLGSTSLSMDFESISIPQEAKITSQNQVLLAAKSSFSGDLGQLTIGSDQLDLTASIDVAGTLEVKGNVVLAAQVTVDLQQDVALTGFYTVNGTTSSRVRVTDGAQITAQSLELSAITDSRWSLAANDGLIGGRLALNLNQSTEALVDGGVSMALAPSANADGSAGVGLVVQAKDWTDASVVLDMADGDITGLSKNTEAGQALEGFELGWTQIDLVRKTVASLGSAAAGQALSSVDGQNGQSAGWVQVSAGSFDGPGDEDGENAGVHGSVMSSLVGLHINNIDHNVLASVANAALEVGALNVYAINDSSHLANGKIAKNTAQGSTAAWLQSVDLSSEGEVAVIASDAAKFSAISEGFSADIPKLDTLKVGVASTSNTVNRQVSAYLLSSTVSASSLAVLASSAGTLSVSLESMAVAGDKSEEETGGASAEEDTSETSAEGAGSSFQMAFGGTLAWNQLNGKTQAYVDNSSVEATDGDVMLQAVNSTAMNAQSKAGTAVSNSSGAAAGASLAFNAVGWDMGNIAVAGLNSLLGTDSGTESPLLTLADLRGSDVTASGDVSVLAQDELALDAQISNASDVVAGDAASGMSVGAAMILASNRVRSETRADADGKKRLEGAAQATLNVGGGLTVSATDDASITADVAMSANVDSGTGGAVAAGGVFSLNDVRSEVSAYAWSLTLTTGGDTSITASATAQISAVLSGEVVAASEEAGAAEGGDEAAAEPAADAGAEAGADTGADAGSGEGGGGATAIAANGLIATNRILIDADASLRDSFVTVSGSLGVEAENTATIDAENTASTESSGTAAGVVLAFNTIGWKPQNIFSVAIDTLIGSDALGQTDSAQSSAEITNTTLDVGEDLTLTAVTVPQINASIENTVQSSGGVAVGLTLASNLVSADSHVLLTPKNEAGEMELPDDTVFAIGGSVLVKASDTSGIVARIGAATGSEGQAALGAQLVRNDVRSTVNTLVDSAVIEAEGDVISLFSEVYTNTTVNTWSAGWDQADVTDITIAGNAVKQYSDLSFAGIEFTSSPINASNMTHLHLDVWKKNADSIFKIKLVDFGADGAFGGGNDVEHELVYNATGKPSLAGNQWVSLDIPLSDLTGLTTRGHLAQMIVSGSGTGDTVWLDNLYLYSSPVI